MHRSDVLLLVLHNSTIYLKGLCQVSWSPDIDVTFRLGNVTLSTVVLDESQPESLPPTGKSPCGVDLM